MSVVCLLLINAFIQYTLGMMKQQCAMCVTHKLCGRIIRIASFIASPVLNDLMGELTSAAGSVFHKKKYVVLAEWGMMKAKWCVSLFVYYWNDLFVSSTGYN